MQIHPWLGLCFHHSFMDAGTFQIWENKTTIAGFMSHRCILGQNNPRTFTGGLGSPPQLPKPWICVKHCIISFALYGAWMNCSLKDIECHG